MWFIFLSLKQQEFSLWCSELRIRMQWLWSLWRRRFNSCPSEWVVKELALPQLRLGFNPWPRKFHKSEAIKEKEFLNKIKQQNFQNKIPAVIYLSNSFKKYKIKIESIFKTLCKSKNTSHLKIMHQVKGISTVFSTFSVVIIITKQITNILLG